MDIVAVTSLVVASSTAIGYIIHQLHLRNCECFCIKSDCVKDNSPCATPIIKDLPRPGLKSGEKSPLVLRKTEPIDIQPSVI
jgi:hypothetical protein